MTTENASTSAGAPEPTTPPDGAPEPSGTPSGAPPPASSEDAAARRRRRRRRRGPGDAARARRAGTLTLAAEIALGATLLAAPLMIGSVPLWAVAIDAALCAATLALAAAVLATTRRRLPVPLLAWVLLAAVAFEALSLVPLPPWLLGLLSPHAKDVYGFVLSDVHAWPAWRSLSLDPVQTGVEVVRHLSAIALFLAVVGLASGRGRRRRLTVLVGLTAMAPVALAFLQRLVGTDHIYGVWPHVQGGSFLFAAFVNPNQFGAYLDLLAPVTLGLALSARDRSRAVLWGLAFALAGGTCLLTLSRGGIVALLAGLTVFAVLHQREPEGEPRPPPPRLRRVLLPLLVGGALSVGAYLALDPILEQVETLTHRSDLEHESRWPLWADSLPMVRDYWLTGIGRGAFRVAFPIYKRIEHEVTFEYAENQPLQLVAELGAPLGLALLVALGWFFVGSVHRSELRPREVGLFAGLVALALHECADFATFFGGVALPAAVVLGLVAAGTRRRSRAKPAAEDAASPTAPRRPRIRRTLAPAAALAAIGVCTAGSAALLARARGHLANDDLASIEAAIDKGAPVAATVDPVIRRRPTDHMPPLVAADALLRRGEHLARAFALVTRAMYLAPSEPRGHLVAADLLARAGHRDQALLELRLATHWGHPPSAVLALAAAWYPDAADIARAVPDDPDDQRAVVEFLLARRRSDDAFALGTKLAEAHPDDPRLLGDLARAALALERPDDAERDGEAIARLSPDDSQGPLWIARARLARGDTGGAVKALEDGLSRAHGDPGLSFTLADVCLSRLHDPKRAKKVLDAMRLPDSPWMRAALHMRLGRIAWAEGKTRSALDSYRTASRLSPRDPGPLIAIGDALMSMDQYERALDVYEDAARRAGSGGSAKAVAARIATAQKAVQALQDFRKRQLLLGNGTPP